MQIHYEIPAQPLTVPIAATVGSYDGVHGGHRHLLAHTKAEAELLQGESMVITFDPHPRLALDPKCDMRLLSTTAEKCRLLEREGIDHLVIIPFDLAFSRTSPTEFLRIMTQRIGVRSLVVGYDHRFGRDKAGSHDLLEELKGELGLRVVEVPEQEIEYEHVSSTVVRRLISGGDVAHASRLLGYPYLLHAQIDPAGRVMAADPHKLLPADGVYRIRVEACEARLEIKNKKMQLKDYQPIAGSYFIEFIQ